ncbi:MAG TPA: TonB-dependent receptor [Firmicutes bacterium]|nr:TonB-dependent receptor [Bacillota bacterium]
MRGSITLTIAVLSLIAISSSISIAEDDTEYYEGERYYRMEPIVVTATRLPVNVSDVPFSVDIIEVDEELHSIHDVLQGNAGIEILSYGGGSNLRTLSIRGSESTQSLILFNGIPLNSAYDGLMDLSLLPSGGVERIEVIKGPLSALYGSNGMGGTVNIITKPLVLGEEGSSIGGGYTTGSYGYKGIDGNLCYSSSNIGIKTGIKHQEGDGFRKNSDYYSDEADLNIGFRPIAPLRIDITGFKKLSNLGVIGPESFEDETARQDDNISSFGSSVEYEFGERATVRSNFSVIKRERHYRSEYVDSLHDLKTLAGGAEVSIKTTEFHTLIAGIDLLRDDVESTDIGSQDTQNTGLFLQNMLIYDRFTYINGVRVDKHSQWGYAITPRQAFLIKASDMINVRSSFSLGFRAPTMVELYWPQDPYFGGGNPDLVPEQSWEWEVGGTIDLKKIDIDGDFYYTRVDDKIVGWTPYNIGESTGYGIDLTAKGEIGYGLSIRGDYSYNKTTDEDDKVLDYHPANKVGITLAWEKPFGIITPNAEFDIRFTDERNATYYDFGQGDYVTVKMPSYTLIDIGGGVNIGPVSINIAVNNLLDKSYQIVYDYPMPGREYKFSISALIK